MHIRQLSGMPREYGWTDEFVLSTDEFKSWFKAVSGGYVFVGKLDSDRKTKTQTSIDRMKKDGETNTVAYRSYTKVLSGAVMNTEEALFWAATALSRKKREEGAAWWEKAIASATKKGIPTTTTPTAPGAAVAIPIKKIKPIYIILPAIGIAGIIAVTLLMKRR